MYPVQKRLVKREKYVQDYVLCTVIFCKSIASIVKLFSPSSRRGAVQTLPSPAGHGSLRGPAWQWINGDHCACADLDEGSPAEPCSAWSVGACASIRGLHTARCLSLRMIRATEWCWKDWSKAAAGLRSCRHPQVITNMALPQWSTSKVGWSNGQHVHHLRTCRDDDFLSNTWHFCSLSNIMHAA